MSHTRLMLGPGLLLAFALGLSAPPSAGSHPQSKEGDWANTYSIVAYDPASKQWGVAVASKVNFAG